MGISFLSLNNVSASEGEESTYKFKVCTYTFFNDCDPLSHLTAIEFKYYDVIEGEWISPYSFHANDRYVAGSYYQPRIERTYFANVGTQLKFIKRSRGENQFRMSKFNGNYPSYPSQANLYSSDETFILEEGIYIIHYNYTRGEHDGKFDFFEFIQIVVGNHAPEAAFSSDGDKIHAQSFDVDVRLSSSTALDVNACGYYWSSNPNLNPNHLTFNNCKYNSNSNYSNYYLWTDLAVKITTPSNLNSGEYYLYFRSRTLLNQGTSNYTYSVSEVYKVDTDAPSTSIVVSNSNPTNNSVSVTYSCEDAGGSGLASCGLYDFDILIHEVSEGNSATYEFNSEIYDKFITYYLRVKASDNAGNTYVSDYNILRADYIAPSIVSVTPDTIGGSDLVRIPEVSVEITISDYGIGIDKTYYKWTDNENEVEDFISYKSGNSFTLRHSTHGVRYLHLKTYDKAGNYSYEYYGPYHIDSSGALIEMYEQHPSADASGPKEAIYTKEEYITIYFVVTAVEIEN